MKYSQKTSELLARIKKVAIRQEFVLEKQKIKKLVKESYCFFNLEIPEIVWCKDITDKRFLEAMKATTKTIGDIWTTRVMKAAGDAWDAGAAKVAWDRIIIEPTEVEQSAESAKNARDAGMALGAWATGATFLVWLWAKSTRYAWGAKIEKFIVEKLSWTATDCDRQEFIFSYEFSQANKIKDEDKKFNDAQELFLQLKESGAGYWAEQGSKIYICPNPIIRLNSLLQYHSEIKPAIEWKNGLKLYFLFDVNFFEDLWKKVVNKTITPEEIFALQNKEQKSAAMRIYGYKNLVKDAKILSECDILQNNKPTKYQVLEYDLKDDDVPARFVKVKDWSSEQEYLLRTDPHNEEIAKDPLAAVAQTFVKADGTPLTKEEFLGMLVNPT